MLRTRTPLWLLALGFAAAAQSAVGAGADPTFCAIPAPPTHPQLRKAQGLTVKQAHEAYEAINRCSGIAYAYLSDSTAKNPLDTYRSGKLGVICQGKQGARGNEIRIWQEVIKLGKTVTVHNRTGEPIYAVNDFPKATESGAAYYDRMCAKKSLHNFAIADGYGCKQMSFRQGAYKNSPLVPISFFRGPAAQSCMKIAQGKASPARSNRQIASRAAKAKSPAKPSAPRKPVGKTAP